MHIDNKEVGARIQNIRKSLGLSLEEFGRRIDNTSRSLVSRWERGVNLPNNKRLAMIAELADMPVDELLYGSFPVFCRQILDELIEQNHYVVSQRDVMFILSNAGNKIQAENLSYEHAERIKEILEESIEERGLYSVDSSITDLRKHLVEIASNYDHYFFEHYSLLELFAGVKTSPILKEGVDVDLYIDIMKLLTRTDQEAAALADKYGLEKEVGKDMQTYMSDLRFLMEGMGYEID